MLDRVIFNGNHYESHVGIPKWRETVIACSVQVTLARDTTDGRLYLVKIYNGEDYNKRKRKVSMVFS
jgi:hypothetical protein